MRPGTYNPARFCIPAWWRLGIRGADGVWRMTWPIARRLRKAAKKKPPAMKPRASKRRADTGR